VTPIDVAAVRAWLIRLADAVALEQDVLDELDGGAGDGDHGATLVLGTRRIVAIVDAEYSSVADLLKAASRAFAGVGGSIGPLWGMALLQAAKSLQGDGEITVTAIGDALVHATEAMAEIGSAQRGDRTLLDAFAAAADAFASCAARGESLEAAAQAGLDAALRGAANTAEMTARRGRAARNPRLAARRVDPGAASIALAWVQAVAPERESDWRDAVTSSAQG
jgi:phosphoenolpyruvate---glycerone phosphotransferase subunit DhaL